MSAARVGVPTRGRRRWGRHQEPPTRFGHHDAPSRASVPLSGKHRARRRDWGPRSRPSLNAQARPIARTQSAAVENRPQLEGERLDALPQSLWEKAMEGDAVAATAIIRVIVARCRLLGPTFESVLSRSAKTATVVVSPGTWTLPATDKDRCLSWVGLCGTSVVDLSSYTRRPFISKKSPLVDASGLRTMLRAKSAVLAV